MHFNMNKSNQKYFCHKFPSKRTHLDTEIKPSVSASGLNVHLATKQLLTADVMDR